MINNNEKIEFLADIFEQEETENKTEYVYALTLDVANALLRRGHQMAFINKDMNPEAQGRLVFAFYADAKQDLNHLIDLKRRVKMEREMKRLERKEKELRENAVQLCGEENEDILNEALEHIDQDIRSEKMSLKEELETL